MTPETSAAGDTCPAETSGYDGLFGMYCELPMFHSGPHNDGIVEWDFLDPELRNSEQPPAAGWKILDPERWKASHDRFNAALNQAQCLPRTTALNLERLPNPVPSAGDVSRKDGGSSAC